MSNTIYASGHDSIRIGHSIRDLLDCVRHDKYLILNGPPPGSFLHNNFHPRLALDSIWSNLYWSLFFRGSVYPSTVDSIVLASDNNCLKVRSPTGSHLVHLGDDSNIEISSIEKISDICDFAKVTESEYHYVYDLFACKKGSIHEKWFLDFGKRSSLAREVYFFISERIDGNRKKKDLVSKSVLSHSEMMQFSNSDTMVRFKLEEELPHRIGLSPGSISLQHLSRSISRNYNFSFDAQSFCKKTEHSNILTKKEYEEYVLNG